VCTLPPSVSFGAPEVLVLKACFNPWRNSVPDHNMDQDYSHHFEGFPYIYNTHRFLIARNHNRNPATLATIGLGGEWGWLGMALPKGWGRCSQGSGTNAQYAPDPGAGCSLEFRT
jgi:hypothetical protein